MQKLAENGNVDQLRKLLMKRMEFGTAGHFLLKEIQSFEFLYIHNLL